jgi:hypothetical protein
LKNPTERREEEVGREKVEVGKENDAKAKISVRSLGLRRRSAPLAAFKYATERGGTCKKRRFLRPPLRSTSACPPARVHVRFRLMGVRPADRLACLSAVFPQRGRPPVCSPARRRGGRLSRPVRPKPSGGSGENAGQTPRRLSVCRLPPGRVDASHSSEIDAVQNKQPKILKQNKHAPGTNYPHNLARTRIHYKRIQRRKESGMREKLSLANNSDVRLLPEETTGPFRKEVLINRDKKARRAHKSKSKQEFLLAFRLRFFHSQVRISGQRHPSTLAENRGQSRFIDRTPQTIQRVKVGKKGTLQV